MSNIVRIKIKNFMSVSNVEIEPGQINQIVGENGQGKTTIVKAIEWAAKGGGDTSLIKIGEDSAEVTIELPDETVIRRRMNGKGDSTVSVTREGFKAPSPQSYLDTLFSSYSLNPIEILEPKKRNEALLQAIDLKVTKSVLAEKLNMVENQLPPLEYDQHGLKVIDQAHKYFYQRRAEANRDAAEKRKRWQVNKEQLGEIPYKMDHTAEQIRSMIKTDEALLNTASMKVTEIENKIKEQAKSADLIKRSEDLLTKIDAEIKLMREQSLRAIEDLQVKHNHAIEMLKANQQLEMTTVRNKWAADLDLQEARKAEGRQYIANLQTSEPIAEPTELRAQVTSLDERVKTLNVQLKNAEVLSSWMKQSEMIEQMDVEAKKAESFAESLSHKVEALHSSIKKDLMSSVEMPVEGLEYRDGEFYISNVAIDNLSTSESIAIAVAISRKLAKTTKIICIDGVESLDENTWALFRKQIDGDGFTYFVSKVGDAFPIIPGESSEKIMKMNKGSLGNEARA
jgi:energy-coupling factor transporter ATP-binding protein EcfA2